MSIDSNNTYLLNDEMLLKTNFFCQIWFLSCFFVVISAHVSSSFFTRRSWFSILQSMFKLNFKWAIVCECCASSYLKMIKRQSLQINERFTISIVMIKKTRKSFKYCFYILYSKFLKTSLINCSANSFIHVLSQLKRIRKQKRLFERQQKFFYWQNFEHNRHLHNSIRWKWLMLIFFIFYFVFSNEL